jgi:hypothetical protein
MKNTFVYLACSLAVVSCGNKDGSKAANPTLTKGNNLAGDQIGVVTTRTPPVKTSPIKVFRSASMLRNTKINDIDHLDTIIDILVIIDKDISGGYISNVNFDGTSWTTSRAFQGSTLSAGNISSKSLDQMRMFEGPLDPPFQKEYYDKSKNLKLQKFAGKAFVYFKNVSFPPVALNAVFEVTNSSGSKETIADKIAIADACQIPLEKIVNNNQMN